MDSNPEPPFNPSGTASGHSVVESDTGGAVTHDLPVALAAKCAIFDCNFASISGMRIEGTSSHFICKGHCTWAPYFNYNYTAKCELKIECKLSHPKPGYKKVSGFYNHLIKHHRQANQDVYNHVYKQVLIEVDKACAKNTEATSLAGAAEPEVGPEQQVFSGNVVTFFEQSSLDSAGNIFSTKISLKDGGITNKKYHTYLVHNLRDGTVSGQLDAAFEVRGGKDMYTGCTSELLLALESNFEANADDLPRGDGAAVHLAFGSRSSTDAARRLLEVDHVWDVQLWARAIMIANKRLASNGMEVEAGLSLGQMLYLKGIINHPENLNVTTHKVNSHAKNKLVTKFMKLWDFAPDGFKHSAGNLLATEFSVAAGCIFKQPLGTSNRGQKTPTAAAVPSSDSPKTVLSGICAAMRSTLFEFIRPNLDLQGTAAEEWRAPELMYFRTLLIVLRQMCRDLWPINEFSLDENLLDD